MNTVRFRRRSSTVMMPARARRSTYCSAALVELFRSTGPAAECTPQHTLFPNRPTHHHYNNQRESQSCHMTMEWEGEDGDNNGAGWREPRGEDNYYD